MGACPPQVRYAPISWRDNNVADTPSGVVPPPAVSPMKRPTGLTAISILWAIFGAVNLYLGLSNFVSDAGAYPLLSTNPNTLNSTQVLALNWLKLALPVDSALSLLVMLVGIAQFFVAFGLWKGFGWSFLGAILVTMMIFASWLWQAILYNSAPQSLGLRDPTLVSGAVSSAFWAFVIFRYLRQANVREFLHRARSEPR